MMSVMVYMSLVLGFILILLLGSDGFAAGRMITDMAGRKVVVPAVIKSAYAPSPYGSTMLYSVAPEKLAGLMFPLAEKDKKHLHPAIFDLPVIGRISNTEAMVKARPDVIIVWADKKEAYHKKSEAILSKLDIPYVYVTVGDLADLCDYPAAYDFLGKLLNKEDHTARESAYCLETLDTVAAVVGDIPASKRPKVYYAEGPDGLSTECDDSLHVHLLKLAGDVNVHRCHTSCHKGFEKVTIEEVLAYDPDVIIAQDKVFVDTVFNDPAWSNINAVQTGRVHLIPHTPFNWFDRPPSFMRIIGLQWLMTCLYPEDYDIDLIQQIQAFFDLFLGVRLSADDAKSMIHR